MKRKTMESVRITKLEVAVRQVKAAVRLFFREDDPVVIHTLIAAAHQILVDLGEIDNIDSVVKNTARLSQAEKRKFLAAVNYSFNFFKHADRDPDRRIDIASLPRFTQDFIMDAILLMFAQYSVKVRHAAPAPARHSLCSKVTLYSAGINNVTEIDGRYSF